MRAFIEYPDVSEDRIEIKTGVFHVITQALHVEDIMEQWAKKAANIGKPSN